MSRKQATIPQEAEYDFMHELMSGQLKGLPKLLIDEANCKELLSSLTLARAEIRYTGSMKSVHKVKKSEKLTPKKLPMLSTNMSDAFKYLLMRRDWMRLVRRKETRTADGAVDQFLEQRRK